ncbi:uncharacterized protein LOC126319903 [Schistocerca gregaria]|uniref:uncharacterized protein LOC126319903 n=1 Tax=Schistocerca gregaria TaxID=7010 RepID=UPI00211DEEDA|nr:uncharacterized protein LOC126319903 [Schistocerca gregaria]
MQKKYIFFDTQDLNSLHDISMILSNSLLVENASVSVPPYSLSMLINIPNNVAYLEGEVLYIKGINPLTDLISYIKFIHNLLEPFKLKFVLKETIVLPKRSALQAFEKDIIKVYRLRSVFSANLERCMNHLLFKKFEEVVFEHSYKMCIDDDKTQFQPLKTFEYACVGGTFDHFHLGHQLLLTASLCVTSKKLLIGVADGPLLDKKEYKEYIQPYEIRSSVVEAFCKLVCPELTVDIQRIFDPVGPAATEEKLQACILSMETEKSINMINEARTKNRLAPIQACTIELVNDRADSPSSIQSKKISSTYFRMKEASNAEIARRE